jgi:hypothetical protein
VRGRGGEGRGRLLLPIIGILLMLTSFTVKKAVELLDAPSKNTFLKSNKYNSKVEIVYLDTHVFFSLSVIE